ncbi:MAG: multidrug resistance efflux transporter family protein [Alicyclobacillus herbarius]|uniref:DMT family transporter n=1 Tax=Alicyclobacillus herbarius TaxID=122960 RepID=UPI002352685D|nr:multidrug resistance efflux transporter family protein [Alicyclobacillus herbarius]MCL6633872.1 multidrug resistance efflux transporter family protein [Alicyclobacillus herbarius]
MKSILLGICASFFFALTFVFNRVMADAGGSWVWSASLRYFFMIPPLVAVVALRRGLRPLWRETVLHPWLWLWWSFVGFGLFYAPLCFAAAYSPAWLTAGAWQFTIVAGSLVVPLFKEVVETPFGPALRRMRIPFRHMGMSLVILFGIGLMEWSQATRVSARDLWLGALPITIAAFAYPLGNRKMMEVCGGRLDAYQRTLGMTVASLPLWLVLSAWQWSHAGGPSVGQCLQSLVVALSSGVVATVLFFSATDLAEGNPRQLAAVEATQSGEVVFALIGELLLIPGTHVSAQGLLGLGLVVVGMVLHSWFSVRRKGARLAAQESVQVTQ